MATGRPLNETHLRDLGQFVGQIALRQTVGGVTLAEVVHTHGRALPAHEHRDPYLSLLVRGRYEDTVVGRLRQFGPADATFSPPGFEHRDRIGTGGARFFTVSFEPSAGSQFTERRGLWETPQRWDATGPALSLARLHVDFSQSGGQLDACHVEAALLDFWSAVAGAGRDERRGAAWLGRARERLHASDLGPPRIAELAVEAGVHPTYFTRAFRAQFGVGPHEYRARLRVMAACRALAGGASIRATAIAGGYADVPHFTRDFAKRVGVTPAAYRQLIGGRPAYT